ncbi:hypothetical protein EDF68_106176 [Ochrobactrum sp. BH3]|nr:hypothetical protein EDF68_106176 [Ochrobactrum sp. BH3]
MIKSHQWLRIPPHRWVVERTFARLGRYYRLAGNPHKTTASVKALADIANTLSRTAGSLEPDIVIFILVQALTVRSIKKRLNKSRK